MIINIPINVDEDTLNKTIERDFVDKIENYLKKRADKAIADKARGYGYSSTATVNNGLVTIAENRIDDLLKDCKEDVIERASAKLAERLARTKAAKEVIQDIKSEILATEEKLVKDAPEESNWNHDNCDAGGGYF